MKKLTNTLTIAAMALSAAIAPALAQDGLSWQYHRDIAATPFDTQLTVIYGIPETDASQLLAYCAIGADGPIVIAELATDVSGLSEGDFAEMTYSNGQGIEGQAGGSVVGTLREEGFSGIEIAAEPGNTFWQAFMNGGQLRYNMQGRQPTTMSLQGADAAMGQLVSDCANIGDLTATVPAPNQGATCESIFTMASLNGDVPQRITFVNGTDGHRSLFWMDYGGQPVHIADLQIGEATTIDTYLTHPWMITDGPGNCLEAMAPEAGQTTYILTAPNQFFGNE